MEFVERHDDVKELQKRYGTLEEIRAKLGLSRRQICAQLFVDPSAWSRWTAGGQDRAPARVYKSLAVLLDARNVDLKAQFATDNARDLSRESISLGWKLIVILNTLGLFYLIFIR